jgi:hypothetical protein
VAERDEDGRQAHQLDRRAMLHKLAVGGSIVWASPMIASRASALMPPSQCVNGAVLNWTTLFPDTFPTLSNPANIVVPGSGVTVTISSTIVGTTAMARNFQVQDPLDLVPPIQHGGITGKSLMFEQRPVPNTDAPGGGIGSDGLGGQTITIAFSTTVRNIQFTITDIDNQDPFGFNQVRWSDRLTLITPPTGVPVVGADIIGIGATGNGTGGISGDGGGGNNAGTGAFRNANDDNNLTDGNGAGNITLTYAGPIDSVSFRYWCGGVGSSSSPNTSNQRINLSNITFDTCPEGVTPNFVQQQSPVESELRVPAGSDDPVAPPTPGVD